MAGVTESNRFGEITHTSAPTSAVAAGAPADASEVTIGYDPFGRPTPRTDATSPDDTEGNPRVEVGEYDSRGCLIAESGAGSYALSEACDEAGNLISMTDGNGAVTT